MPLETLRLGDVRRVPGREAPSDAASQNWLDWNPYTYPFNLTRQPAISLPAGISASGLPVGLQLVGPWDAEQRLFMLSQALEQDLGLSGGIANLEDAPC